MEEFSDKGFFWFPGEKKSRLPGNIIFKNNKLIIELYISNNRALVERFSKTISESSKIPILHSQLHKKGLSTIKSCLIIRLNTVEGQNSSSSLVKLEGFEIFCGKLFKKDPRMTDIYFKFSNIEEWVGMNLIKTGKLKKNFSGLNISCTNRQIFKFELENNLTFSLYSSIDGISYSSFNKEMRLEQKSNFRLGMKNKNKIGFKKLKSNIIKLQNLFAVLVNNKIKIKKIYFYEEENQHKEISYYFTTNKGSHELNDIYRILFPYSLTKRSLRKIVNNWLKNYDKNEMIFNIFLGTYYNEKMFLFQKILTRIQCLEAIHYNNFNREIISKTILKRDLGKILELDLDTRTKEKIQALKGTIKSPSLRDRITDLIKMIDERIIEELQLDKEFVSYCVKTRNDYSHLNSKSKKENSKMYIMSEKIKIIILYIILTKILEVNKKLVLKCFKGNLIYKPLWLLKD